MRIIKQMLAHLGIMPKDKGSLVDPYDVPWGKWEPIDNYYDENCVTYLKEWIWLTNGKKVVAANCYKDFPRNVNTFMEDATHWMRQFPFDEKKQPSVPNRG